MTNSKMDARATARKTFASLVVDYNEASEAVRIADVAMMEAKSTHAAPERARILGGRNEAYSFAIDGRTHSFPESEWFFSSIEEIDRAMDKELSAKDLTVAGRREIEARRKTLWAELRIAIAAYDKKVHPAIRAARAAVVRAEQKYETALAAIVHHKPKTLPEGIEMLRHLTMYAGERGHFGGDEVVSVIRNVIPAFGKSTSARS
jgi:hypothetical protein